MSRISTVFRRLKKAGKKAFIPYIMAGDPSLEATERFVLELEEAGADIIELGVPFTDPLADGPAIQRAHERSLKQGVTLRKVLTFVGEVRHKTGIPLILMTYFNPVFKYGVEAFVREAVRVGADGVIIPDLIPDEADELKSIARASALDTIFLLAPTSTGDRIRKVVKASTGFIYYVSVTGITGTDILIDTTMKDTLSAIKTASARPVAVGFGISRPEEAAAAAALADGIIVGSAIVRLIAGGKDIASYARSLRDAI